MEEEQDSSVDGIFYLECSKDREIFERARQLGKDFINNSDWRNERKFPSDTFEYPHHPKPIFNDRENNSDTSRGRDMRKIQSVHSSSPNTRIKYYPAYSKASYELSSNHICEAKSTSSGETKYQLKYNNPGICNKKSDSHKINRCKSLELDIIKKEVEELKGERKVTGETQQEILNKIEKIEEDIMSLKNDVDCERKQTSYQKYQSKLLEMGYLDHYLISISFINVFDPNLSPSNEKFDVESINSMISWQKAALQEQNEKTLQGLHEIKELLNENCKSRIMK